MSTEQLQQETLNTAQSIESSASKEEPQPSQQTSDHRDTSDCEEEDLMRINSQQREEEPKDRFLPLGRVKYAEVTISEEAAAHTQEEPTVFLSPRPSASFEQLDKKSSSVGAEEENYRSLQSCQSFGEAIELGYSPGSAFSLVRSSDNNNIVRNAGPLSSCPSIPMSSAAATPAEEQEQYLDEDSTSSEINIHNNLLPPPHNNNNNNKRVLHRSMAWSYDSMDESHRNYPIKRPRFLQRLSLIHI